VFTELLPGNALIKSVTVLSDIDQKFTDDSIIYETVTEDLLMMQDI
jgi:hypothetical protein